MPQYTRAKTAPRRKRFFRRKNPAKTVKEWELTRLRKSLKRMMPKPEWKYFPVDATAATITSTATITNLAGITQADAETGRDGDKITAKSLFIRLSVIPNATAGVNFLRYIIVQDKQANGAAFTAADLLESPTNYLSPRNRDTGKRFKVLFDRTYTVDTDANGSQVDKIYRKMRFVIEYPGNTAIPNTNSLYLCMLSDQATNGPTVAYYSVFRFTDV